LLRDGITAAIAGACEAIVRLLRSRFDPAEFGAPRWIFRFMSLKTSCAPWTRVFRCFSTGFITTDTTHSVGTNPPGRQPRAYEMPVDVHFLLTAWRRKLRSARDCGMDDAGPGGLSDPDLGPAQCLPPGVFLPDEGVDVGPGQLSVRYVSHLGVMINHVYQLSVPYQMRVLQIESELVVPQDRRYKSEFLIIGSQLNGV